MLCYVMLSYHIISYIVVSAKIVETRGKACKKLATLIFEDVNDMLSAPRKCARRYHNHCMCVQVCSLYL